MARQVGRLDFSRLGEPVSNVWILRGLEAGPVLIDSGWFGLRGALRAGLLRQGIRPGELSAVILTHHHGDHAGNASWLTERYGAPVYAHRRDADVLARRAAPAPFPPARGLVAALIATERRFPPAACEGIRSLEDGDRVAGLEVHHVPGHTAGSVFLYHRPSGTLFTGDTLLSAEPPLVRRARLSLPYPAFCADPDEALASLERFFARERGVRLLCPGHGPPRLFAPRDDPRGMVRAARRSEGPAHTELEVRGRRRAGVRV